MAHTIAMEEGAAFAHRQMIKIYEFMRFGPELKLQVFASGKR